jgi:diguanylate cyclase (GGDEF)-like protein
VIVLAVAAAGGIAIYQQLDIARVAAIRDAQHLAESIAHDITYNPTGSAPPLLANPTQLQAYTESLYQIEGRDIEVIDDHLLILADRDARDVGTPDARGVISRTIADGAPRATVETDPQTQARTREVVVPIKGRGHNLGAIVLEYTPLYQEIMSRTTRTIVILGATILGELLLAIGLGAMVLRAISDRVRADEAITQRSRELAQANDEANRSRREVYLLHQMGELLQSCATLEEAYSVFRAIVGQFFPDDTGAVYVIADSRNIVEAMVTWGPRPPDNGSAVFAPDECWSLRRGRPHYVEGQTAGLVCKHLPTPLPCASLCVPLVAHGEALGVLYLVPGDGTSGTLSEAKQRLADTIAEPLALALANLKLRQTLRNQSIRDPLTGLFNRRYLEETLERELRRAERTRHSVGVIALDIDLFKQFNDTFGHDAGDALLSEVGAAMRRHFRREDILCRYGGEEFTVILPDTTLEDAVQRANQLRELVAGLNVSHRGRSLGSVTLSLGVAVFPEHGTTVDALLHAADQAMYQAKENGRARTEVAQPQAAR